MLDSAFPVLKDRIIERTGHFYYQDKDDALQERVARRLGACGLPDCTAYLSRLDDPERGRAEWAALESEITIGETFFFRYTEQFTALRDTILPALLERARETKRLRIWSAGCSTGAEAYSIAILLRELLGDATDDWRISIIGTDIDDDAIAKARIGVFARWALRGMTEEAVGQYFVKRDKNAFALKSEYRAMARFERLNLIDLLGNAAPLQFTDFDLVLCRNVLIYFHPDTAFEILSALRDRLLLDGWLLVGSAEPSPRFAEIVQPVNLPGTLAYRRVDEAALRPPSEPASPLPVLAEATSVPRRRSLGTTRPQRPPPQPASSSVLPIAAASPGKAPALLVRAREYAGRGEAEQAQNLCEEAIRAEPTDPRSYFYYGMIILARGHSLEAERAFRRALYLDKTYIMAHYQLGFVLINHGKTAAGRRFVSNAAALAGSLPPQSEIADGDGITAALLRDNARHYLNASPPIARRPA